MVILYWNYVLFFILIVIDKVAIGVNYVNPVWWLNKTSAVKNFYKKHGIDDMNKFTEDVVFKDGIYGFNIQFAFILHTGLIIVLEYAIFNFIQILTNSPIIKTVWENFGSMVVFILCLLIPAITINYYSIHKDNKFLKFIEQFKKFSKGEKKKYSLISIGIVTMIFLILIGSFYLQTVIMK
jgi:hypothetical protein